MAGFAEVLIEFLPTEKGGRRTPVCLSNDLPGHYSPHFRVREGDGEMLGVQVVDGPDDPVLPGGRTSATVRFVYEPEVSYDALVVGAEFEVLEGPRVVGIGRVTRRHNHAEMGISVALKVIDAAEAMVSLERTIAAVKGQEGQETKFAKALATLKTLSRKEGIPLAIVGGLAAIHHGYERFTKDINVVVRCGNLDILTRVAPQYGIKVIWDDPEGWHKLQCEGVPLDVVPEGRKPRKDAPTRIPGPTQLGVREGADYAGIAGWMETKLGSYRVQDRADVVQVIKVTTAATLSRIRKHLGKVHAIYLRRFDELLVAAKEEMEQERERGGTK